MTFNPLPTRRLLAIVALLLAVVATGCLQGDVDVKVDGDGSGEVVVEVFPTSELRRLLRSVDVESTLDGAFRNVDGYEFEEFELDSRDGYRVIVPFDDYRDLEEVLVGGGSVNGRQVQLFESFTLTELPEEGGWSLDATLLPLGQVIAASRPDGVPATEEELMDMAGVGAAGTGLDLTISLPGDISSSNAAVARGGSATWRLDESDAPTTLEMRTVPKEFPTTTQWMLIIGGGVLLVGLILFVISAVKPHRTTRDAKKARRSRSRGRSRRRGRQDEVDTSAWSSAPPPGTPSLSDRPAPLPTIAPVPGPAASIPGGIDPNSPAPAPAPAAQPGQPAQPVQPVQPAQQAQPVQPQPAQPVQVQPVQPLAPVQPLHPEEPVAPVVPIHPVAPTQQMQGPAPEPNLPPPPIDPDLPTVPVSDPPGWYPDPAGEAEYRWWTGDAWTEHTN